LSARRGIKLFMLWPYYSGISSSGSLNSNVDNIFMVPKHSYIFYASNVATHLTKICTHHAQHYNSKNPYTIIR
jgi:hypothetical protein